MSDRVLVNVKVDEDKKDRWDRKVEESDEYSTMSHLIRLAVSRELSGMYDDTSAESDVDVDLDGVDGQLDEIQQTVDEIALRMDTLEAEALSGEDVLEVADGLYDLIPEMERQVGGVPSAESMVMEATHEIDDLSNIEDLERDELENLLDTGLLTVYREYLDVSEYAAQKAAEKLAKEYPGVQSEEKMGHRIIYEVVRS